MLGLLGAGLLYVWPNKPWMGWSFIGFAFLIGAWRFGRHQERKWMERPGLDLTIDEAFIERALTSRLTRLLLSSSVPCITGSMRLEVSAGY